MYSNYNRRPDRTYSTDPSPENRKIAQLLKDRWEQAGYYVNWMHNSNFQFIMLVEKNQRKLLSS